MINRPIKKSLTRSLRNKTILERAGISARAYLTPTRGHTLAIFPDTTQASAFTQDFRTLNPGANIFLLPEMPLSQQSANIRALLLERGEILRRWAHTDGVIAASPGALMSSCLVGVKALRISRYEKFSPDTLKEWLIDSGYTPSSLVWLPGQFAQRGFILDVYDPAYALPLRFEFLDDDVERIGGFFPDTQKTSSQLMHLEEIILHGITEAERAKTDSLMPDDTLITLYEPAKVESQAESFIWLWREVFDEIKAGYIVDEWEKIFVRLAKFPVVRITNDPVKSDAEFPTDSLPAFRGNSYTILNTCDELSRNGYAVDVFTNNPIFQKLPYTIHDGNLSAGFVDKEAKRVFISERELSGINAGVSLTQRHTPNDWNEGGKLSPGQLVIHEDN